MLNETTFSVKHLSVTFRIRQLKTIHFRGVRRRHREQCNGSAMSELSVFRPSESVTSEYYWTEGNLEIFKNVPSPSQNF